MSAVGDARPGARLRVGLVLLGELQPRWIHRLWSKLAADPAYDVVALRLPAARPGPTSSLLRGYERLDRARYARPHDALSLSEIGPRLAGTSSPPVALDADSGARLRALALDVVLCLGTADPGLRVPDLAKFGVLALRHGCGDDGLSEVLRAEPATRTELLLLGEAAASDVVIDRSFSQTDATSFYASRERRAEKGGEMLLRALRRLRDGAPLATAAASEPVPARARPVAGLAAGLLRLGARRLRERVARLVFEDRWIVAAMGAPTWPPDPARFVDWLPPPGFLWADPFPFERDGRTFVFLEECALGAARAHLSVLEVGPDGRPGPARRILERPYHLSYPFVFEWQGTLYLMPESAENRTVELHRCVSFPDRWEPDRVLLAGLRAFDATLFEEGGRFWLFACVAVEDAPPLDELHLFHGPSPLGPFVPVAGNPVVSDVRRARPAGRVFRDGDAWIRPSQDGGGRYGRAVRFQKIERLDPEGYAEREIRVLEPGWRGDVLGVHTWNATPGLAVLDVIKRRRRF